MLFTNNYIILTILVINNTDQLYYILPENVEFRHSIEILDNLYKT